MNQTQDAAPEPTASPYLRLPAVLVALALVAFLGVLLGVGLYANANLRPQGEILPTPAAAGSTPAAAATLAPAAPTATLVAPTPTAPALTDTPAVPSATVAPTIAPTTLPATAATAQQTSVVVNVGATPTGQATLEATPLPTVEPALAAEVGQAYESYWRVTSQALLDLDVSHLSEVMDEPYLDTFEAQLEELSASGRAIKTKVTLNYKVVEVSNSLATLVDRVEDDSYYVKPGTEEPLTSPAGDLERLEVKLNKYSGTWKVVESVSAD